ncbi:pilus (MSHA type) biogenesis protein MshL [Leeia sp. TBRC 13508]|uniref:Pilus (MSHA type) biogenesis protein MshL n=1 Tax=Leeia speluncae TaxID=2884804 RepID=A0ABS8D669_9NEIS|nr:pilus (MSHA type) biogenesis protein MshL [Leeia speluncae]MCB6183679.1 pilus (MSHA type) biogenesis protein MshL [Leeia speluncae]
MKPLKVNEESHLFFPSNGKPDSERSVVASQVIQALKERDGVLSLSSKKMTVTVNKVPVADLLYQIAKDARLNIEIAEDVSGEITLNLNNQTIGTVFGAIADSAGLRYEQRNNLIKVEKDTPYLLDYAIDYLNISRTTKAEVNISTSLGNGLATDALQGNRSNTILTNATESHFWQSLTDNINAILKEKEKLIVVGKSVSTKDAGEANTNSNSVTKVSIEGAQNAIPSNQEVAINEREVNVISNPDGGVISVRATAKQHQKIARFLDRVLNHAGRQVLIEATIAEVMLSDEFQSGVDWSRMISNRDGFSVGQQLTGNRLGTSPVTAITYQNQDSALFSGTFSATLKMLESFGKTKVLSSPKIMAMNSQTALLKVVDEKVYFTVTLDESKNEKGDVTDRKYTSALHTVPVGVVMSVLPQISNDDQVMLNIRPTISRITGYKQDPVPQLMNASFQNLVPEIQVRELESILKVPDGQVVVLGGLMQDEIQKTRDGVPILNRIPLVGDLFAYQDQKVVKSELVIFLRPVIIKNNRFQQITNAHHAVLPTAEFLTSALIDEPQVVLSTHSQHFE